MWRPLLQFVALGALLFAADRLWWSVEPPPPVVIPEGQVALARQELARLLGRTPSGEELARALEPEVEDVLLVREALARGYERDDPVVFRRLVQNLRFAGADPERSDVELFREALDLDLHRTDVVVRRRLAQRLRLDFEAAAVAEGPSEDEVRAHFERTRDDHRSPARVRLAQLYFRGERADEAARVLARLRAEAVAPEQAGHPGDAFLHARDQPSQSRRELADRFGAAFADAAFVAPVGAWSGPHASAYGVHLVWVHGLEPARELAFEEVASSVRFALLAERRREALDRALAELRRGVEVELAGVP